MSFCLEKRRSHNFSLLFSLSRNFGAANYHPRCKIAAHCGPAAHRTLLPGAFSGKKKIIFLALAREKAKLMSVLISCFASLCFSAVQEVELGQVEKGSFKLSSRVKDALTEAYKATYKQMRGAQADVSDCGCW